MNSNNVHFDNEADNDEVISETNDSTVLVFDENSTISTGRDINNKITSLDTDLRQLRAELEIINGSVEEGLDRLSDRDTDLTAKVSETYKRLGEIDKAYKALMVISSRIDSDIQKLNGEVSQVAEQSASGIKSLERSSLTQSKEFAEKSQQVVTRVNHLVETSKLTNEMMNQSIQSVTEKMLLIEKSIVAQIDSLSRVTKDRTSEIEKSLDHNSAAILKLQSVDEAISRRASQLEVTSAELSARGQYLDSSVEQLQVTTDILSSGLKALRERTQDLENVSRHHGLLIDGLQKAGADIAAKLAALSGREGRHFRFVSMSILLLLALSVVMYIGMQSQFNTAKSRYVDNNEKITGLQQAQAELQQVQAGLQQVQATAETRSYDSLAILESKIEQVNAELRNVHDQVESVDGRLSQSLPQSRFGNDNVIHGPQVVAGLPAEHLTLQLAYADDKESLYEIARRYRYQLKDSLYYFSIRDKDAEKYVLLSGNYADRQQALSALGSLPAYIDRQKPVIRKLAVVQGNMATVSQH